jgi:glycopeptide antibiotics resistance protein
MEPDKKLHFMRGACICCLILLLSHNTILALCCSLLVSVGWEIYQKVSSQGCPDIYDIVAEMIGALSIAILYLVLINI